MPKEQIHFSIAQGIAKKLAQSCPSLSEDTQNSPSALLLGSIFHDLCFYIPQNKSLQKLSGILHGHNGEDTYQLLREQAKLAKKQTLQGQGAATCALLVGIVSHICADATLHPMIFYFCGNPLSDAKALERHRRFETLLDMSIKQGKPTIENTQIRQIVETLSHENIYPAEALANIAHLSSQVLHQELTEASYIWGRLQQHFYKPFQAGLAHSCRYIMPQSSRNFLALFYAPQLRKYLHKVQGTLYYKHPVTGEALQHSVENLIEQAIERSLLLLRGLEDYIYHNGSLDLENKGPSLETGLAEVPLAQARHTAKQPLLDL